MVSLHLRISRSTAAGNFFDGAIWYLSNAKGKFTANDRIIYDVLGFQRKWQWQML